MQNLELQPFILKDGLSITFQLFFRDWVLFCLCFFLYFVNMQEKVLAVVVNLVEVVYLGLY